MRTNRIESPASLPSQKYLFYEKDLHGVLRHYKEQARPLVYRIPDDDFIDATDDEILEQVVESLKVMPINVEEKPKLERDYVSPVKKFHLKFTGDAWLFSCRSKTISHDFPVADVDVGKEVIVVRVDLASNSSSEQLKKVLDTQLELVHDYVRWSAEQIDNYHRALPNVVCSAIAHRRAVIARHHEIARELEMPVLPREDAPSLTPRKIELRKHAQLAEVQAGASSVQRYITDQTYESVLHCIRHIGRTFETVLSVENALVSVVVGPDLFHAAIIARQS